MNQVASLTPGDQCGRKGIMCPERSGKLGSRVWNVLTSPKLCFLGRLLLGGIFVVSAGFKLADPWAFGDILREFQILPGALVPVTAVALPVVEALAGLGLMANLRGSLSVIAGLLLVFIAVLLWSMGQGLDMDCGCFGASSVIEEGGLTRALYRDLAMVGVAVWLYLARRLRPDAAPGFNPFIWVATRIRRN
jgi:hypothetical protein